MILWLVGVTVVYILLCYWFYREHSKRNIFVGDLPLPIVLFIMPGFLLICWIMEKLR